jgi:hypothetical protein
MRATLIAIAAAILYVAVFFSLTAIVDNPLR